MMDNSERYSLTNDTEITGDDIAVKDMLVQKRPIKEMKKIYCRNCGNKVLDTDKFCSRCGHAIEKIIEQPIRTVHNLEEKQSTHHAKELPKNWWNFWQYVRFPVGIICLVVGIVDYLPTLDVNMINIYTFLIDLAVLVIMFITYYHFLMENKIGYNFLNSWLVIELVTNALTTTTNSFADNYEGSNLLDFAIYFVITVCILGIIWTLPNYIYFKKRKSLFNDNIKNSK